MASELGFGFDAAYCPDYVRSQETGGVIGTEVDLCVKWRESGLFGERNWGDFETLSAEAQEQGYGQRIEDPRHWTPPHGESMGSLELGVRLALGTLHRKHNMQNVLVSSHGERINAFRSVIERLPLDRFKEIMDEGPPNCGIVHYSRVNPKTGEIAPHWAWMRLVCPWKMDIVKAGEKWDGEWRKIERPEYTSQELLERVSQFEQIYDQEL